MIRALALALLFSPAAAGAQELLGQALPGMPDEAEVAGEPRRPDPAAVLGEISSPLKLSSKQQDRIKGSLNRQAKEFDSVMKEYQKREAAFRKEKEKADELKAKLLKITGDIPDTVKEHLDEEQRQAYDGMMEARKNRRRPAPEPALEEGSAPAEEMAPAPKKKRKLVRRKKRPAGAAMPGAPAPGGPAAAPAPEGGPEEGGVMVDKPEGQPAPRKRRVLRRKAPPPPAEEPAEDIFAEPAGAKPTGKAKPAEKPAPAEEGEEDAGSYP